ncbi:MAG: hypothetical protein KDA42_19050, partial [Planctomycetales bacterium]|nr:hypothetical protein [Planctomycetales bacterium]
MILAVRNSEMAMCRASNLASMMGESPMVEIDSSFRLRNTGWLFARETTRLALFRRHWALTQNLIFRAAVFLAGFISLPFFSPARTTLGEEPAKSTAAVRLLEAGWELSLPSYEAALAMFRAAPTDPSASYAMTLVAVRHRRYDDAEEALHQLINLRSQAWQPQEDLLWVLIAKRDYPAALLKIQELMLRLGDKPGEAESLDRGRILGRMFAYLEAPAEGEISDNSLALREEEILTAAPDQLGKSFSQGRVELIVEFADRIDDFEHNEKQAAVERAEASNSTQREIAEERSEVGSEADKLSVRLNELKTDLQTLLSKLDAELKPAADRLEELKTEAAPKLAKLRDINKEIDDIGDILASLDDGERGRAGRLLNTGRQMQRERDKLERELAPVVREGRELEAKAAGLWQQRIAATAKYEKESKALSRSLALIKRKDSQLSRAEERL